MTGLTLAEKISTRHVRSGPERAARAGDVVVLPPRHMMARDNSVAGSRQFEAHGVKQLRYPWQPLIDTRARAGHSARRRLGRIGNQFVMRSRARSSPLNRSESLR
jgi:hypothetical protein